MKHVHHFWETSGDNNLDPVDVKDVIECAQEALKAWAGLGKTGPKYEEIFKGDRGYCVYCGRDLVLPEDFLTATEDHLVPQALGGERRRLNLVTACSACNSLKGPGVPSPSSDAWKRRKDFIAAARRHINLRRDVKLKEYSGWISKMREPLIGKWENDNGFMRDYLP